MPGFEVSVRSPSLDRFQARVARLSQQYQGALVRGVQRAGEIAKEEEARLAPASFGPHFYVRLEGSGEAVTAHVGVDPTAKPHAGFVDRRTGIYATPTAHRSWTVQPIRARALRFVFQGRVVFAKRATIRGMRGRQFMRKGLQAARPRITRSVASSMAEVTRALAGE